MFLDFISYSGGPLPEELIRDAPVPVSVLWGECRLFKRPKKNILAMVLRGSSIAATMDLQRPTIQAQFVRINCCDILQLVYCPGEE